MKVKLLSCVGLLATPWTAAYQAPPPMGFSRPEYWSGVSLPSPSLLARYLHLVVPFEVQLILSTLGTLKLQPFQNGTHRFLLFLSVLCAFLLVSLSLDYFTFGCSWSLLRCAATSDPRARRLRQSRHVGSRACRLSRRGACV